MIRILSVDDHIVVRRGLKQIISENPGLAVAGEAGSGAEALTKAAKLKPDAVVLDIAMPGLSGLEVLKRLKLAHPRLPVLVLSVYPEDQYAIRMLKAGAAGYLTKESAPEELVRALRKIAAGGRYITPVLAEKIAFCLGRDDGKRPHERLSDREFEVLRLIASGKRTAEIAGQLCLSPKTVHTYRGRILEKTGMKSNAELTSYAVREGLVNL